MFHLSPRLQSEPTNQQQPKASRIKTGGRTLGYPHFPSWNYFGLGAPSYRYEPVYFPSYYAPISYGYPFY